MNWQLPTSAEETLKHEKHTLDAAIVTIEGLIMKCPPSSRQLDYYRTMQEVLIALQWASGRWENYSHMYGKLLTRVEILEMALANERKKSLS